MTDITLEQRAREWLAAECKRLGYSRLDYPPVIAAIEAALRLAVPEGFVVVPRVLTDEMLKAGHKSQWSAPPDTDYHGVPANTLNSIYQHIYAAQIAAAPTVSAEGEAT